MNTDGFGNFESYVCTYTILNTYSLEITFKGVKDKRIDKY